MLRITSQRKILGMALAAVVFIVGSTASALDFNDVRNLIANNVPENVIYNMVSQDPSLSITPAQAAELRSLGMSEAVISSIRHVQPAPVVTSQPSSLPESFVSTTGETYYLNPSTGTYYQASPSVVVTPAPTVIYESPVVYTTPTYVYPYSSYRPRSTWNFSFDFGGHGRRHHRGGPRHHRW